MDYLTKKLHFENNCFSLSTAPCGRSVGSWTSQDWIMFIDTCGIWVEVDELQERLDIISNIEKENSQNPEVLEALRVLKDAHKYMGFDFFLHEAGLIAIKLTGGF